MIVRITIQGMDGVLYLSTTNVSATSPVSSGIVQQALRAVRDSIAAFEIF
jgi:hypothetical protein